MFIRHLLKNEDMANVETLLMICSTSKVRLAGTLSCPPVVWREGSQRLTCYVPGGANT